MQDRRHPVSGRTGPHAGSGPSVGPDATDEREEGQDVELARGGDREAFGRLYDRYAQRIYRFVAYRVRDDDTALDLTGDVFFRALAAMPRYRPRERFAAWLYRIARNAAIDHVRRAALRTRVPLDEAAVHPDAAGAVVVPDDEVIARERRARLRAAIALLTPDQQDAVILRFVEGLETAEAAAILGKREVTMRDLQRRALRALAKHLRPEDLR
jgi:RNA polymerase sigma-70 factor (ECF subfamily)